MRITERELEKVLLDKSYWRTIWLNIVADSARENRRQMEIHEARRQGSRAPPPLSGIPDSTIARVSSIPVNESRQKFAMATDGIIDKNGVRENWSAPTFDSSYEVRTIEPNRKVRFLRPEVRSGDPTQRHTVKSLSMRDRTENAAINEILRQWNSYKEPTPQPLRKIVIQRKTLEKRR